MGRKYLRLAIFGLTIERLKKIGNRPSEIGNSMLVTHHSSLAAARPVACALIADR
jgi:hypothetical protein